MNDRPGKFKEIVIDHSIVSCNGCKGERRFDHEPFITSIPEFEAFVKSIPPCPCGATTCDVAMHLVGETNQ